MVTTEKNNLKSSFKIIIYVIISLWIILIISYIFPSIKQFGIRPRVLIGLIGIIFSPILHNSFNHLLANSISLLVLGSIFLMFERKLSLLILINIIIIGGIGTWLIGRSNFVHIGASGVIYGIIGYLLSLGLFKKNLKAIFISIVVFILFGGAIWGIIPVGNTILSWESHLCGFLAGILTAGMFSKTGKS